MATYFNFTTPGTWLIGTVTRWPLVKGETSMLVTVERQTTQSAPTPQQPNRTITVAEEFTIVVDKDMKDFVRQAVSSAGKAFIEPGGQLTIGLLGILYGEKLFTVNYVPPTQPRNLFGTVISGIKLARSFLGLGGS